MNKKHVFSIILIVSLVFVIISLAYHATAFRSSLYPLDEQKNIRDYLIGVDALKTDMSVEEVSHLGDVKNVMVGVFITSLLALAGIVICSVYLRKDKKSLIENYKKAGIITIISVVSVSVIGALSFNFLFTIFHKIFFPQGNWIFPSDSVLIDSFPQSFFTMRAIEILIASIVLAIIFIGGGFYLQRKNG